MFPTLFHLILPAWRIPLGLAIAGVTIVAGAAWLLAVPTHARRDRQLAAFAALGALAAILGQGKYLSLGPLPAQSFGLMLAVGLFLGWRTARSVSASLGDAPAATDRVCLAAAAGGLVGARWGHAVLSGSPMLSALNVREGGFHLGGALLGALVAVYAVTRTVGRARHWLDILAPSALVAACSFRIGDYLHGSHFGLPLPSGSPAWLEKLGTFPRWPTENPDRAGSAAWIEQVVEGTIGLDATSTLPVHPLQLYEAALTLALAFGALRHVQRRTFPGATFLLASFGYGAVRLAFDWFSGERGVLHLGPDLLPVTWFGVQSILIGAGLFLGPWREGSLRERGVALTLAAALALTPFVAARSSGSIPLRGTVAQWLVLAAIPVVVLLWRQWRTVGTASEAAADTVVP